MKIRRLLFVLLLSSLFLSCNTKDEKTREAEMEESVEPGFKLDPTRSDPNEKILIPEEWNPELIYNTWKISSIKSADKLELNACDRSRKINFSKNRKGSQSGIPHFAMDIINDDENCPRPERKTVWYFNPYVEREIVLINLAINGQFLAGSFKITGLNSNSMTLIKDFYQINFSRYENQ